MYLKLEKEERKIKTVMIERKKGRKVTGACKCEFTVMSTQSRVYSYITIYLLIIVLFICIIYLFFNYCYDFVSLSFILSTMMAGNLTYIYVHLYNEGKNKIVVALILWLAFLLFL